MSFRKRIPVVCGGDAEEASKSAVWRLINEEAMVRRRTIAFVFGGTWIETLPMAHELVAGLKAEGWGVDVYNLPEPGETVPRSSITTKTGFPTGRLWPWKEGMRLLLNERYDGYIGSSGAGIWCASVWAALHRRPLGYLSDEMSAENSRWRSKEIRAHRRCDFTIVPDLCRWNFLKDLNKLGDDARVFELPNSPRRQPTGGKERYFRGKWGLKEDDICLLSMGGFDERYGVDRLLKCVPKLPPPVKLVVHERATLTPTVRALAEALTAGQPNLRFSWETVSYADVNSVAKAGDVGLSLYHDKDQNFALMGKASGKIGFYLANAIPVIYEDFDNLRWISEAGAGEAAHTPEEILRALERIMTDLPRYKQRAKELFDEKLNPEKYLGPICGRIGSW